LPSLTHWSQPNKLRSILQRSSHFLRKSVAKVLGRTASEPDWGREDPDSILSAVRDNRIANVVDNCMQASFKYAPDPHPQSVIQFRSTERMSLLMTQVDKYSQWETITCGGIREIVVPGSHHEVLQPPAVETVAATLRDMLETA